MRTWEFGQSHVFIYLNDEAGGGCFSDGVWSSCVRVDRYLAA